ncbi:acetolactate synthase [Actinosynnema sp. ALI-1.44]|uniref:acetolactate synthase n=1 Tax=Actinosynnema sp. ALI-1.44 TaxID=1933779 RepID=UPI00097C4820|nr:acetolactate synthase [Actinosynnema sp. ALI-1.44]ONI77993.1 acetolactate synthase [Actinosynnema sp. ALI-1.44]
MSSGTISTAVALDGEGGDHAIAVLRAAGVDTIFTLSGGHIFSFLHAAANAGLRIVDVRHEQTAVFAAEGYAKLSRGPGVAVLTAGPGVTNGISGIATAQFTGSPLVVLGGRAAQKRWGAGSLQELDHVPIVQSLTKLARTVTEPGRITSEVQEAIRVATTPHRGPVFLDFPIDVLHQRSAADPPRVGVSEQQAVDGAAIERAAGLIACAERPVLVAGGDVWWGGAWDALRRVAESLRVPVFANGMGRGCLPADHELAFARTRSALKQADVVAVVGTPLDFRLSFGRFGSATVVHIVNDPSQRSAKVDADSSPAGDLSGILAGMAAWHGDRRDHEQWISQLRDQEHAKRATDRAELEADSEPIHPARIIGELKQVLDRDAIIIGDGGDFVSYAGRYLDSHVPGCWLDAGPFGCLGSGIGYAIAARLRHPGKQIALLLGDGSFGFSAMDVDTLVRHRLPVAMVMGNNGIWGLEKHPMRKLYGSDVAADLRPGCRYDQVVEALGGAGEVVRRPGDIRPALERAFASDRPYLVNVLTDPEITYDRTAKLG